MKYSYKIKQMIVYLADGDFASARNIFSDIAKHKGVAILKEHQGDTVYYRQLKDSKNFTVEQGMEKRWQLFLNGQVGRSYAKIADMAYDIKKAINPIDAKIMDHSIDDQVKYVVSFSNQNKTYTIAFDFIRDINGRELNTKDRHGMNSSLAKSFFRSIAEYRRSSRYEF